MLSKSALNLAALRLSVPDHAAIGTCWGCTRKGGAREKAFPCLVRLWV